jgi:lipopolysaccharide export system protein LptA
MNKTLMFISVAMFLLCGFCPAAIGSDVENRKDGIHIQSEELKINHKTRQAEFIGNVRVTQDSSEILSDRLKIYYKAVPESGTDSKTAEQSIDRLLAEGNVRIKFDDITAVTEKAVYTVENRVLILEGDGSKVTLGKDSMSGKKIILHRDTMDIKINGGVEGTFYPGKKGLN